MADSEKSGLWALVGKFATIVTISGALIGLWTWYKSPSTDLQAEVEYGTYRIDPMTTQSLEELNKAAESNARFKFSGSKELNAAEEAARAAEKAAAAARDALDNPYEGYVRAEIKNNGDLTVKEVIYRVPNARASIVTFEDGTAKSFGEIPTIDVGEIKPEQTVSVYSWTRFPLTEFSGIDEIALHHSAGSGSVIIKGQLNVLQQILTSPFALLLLLPVLIMIGSAYDSGKKEGKKEAELKGATETQDKHDSNAA